MLIHVVVADESLKDRHRVLGRLAKPLDPSGALWGTLQSYVRPVLSSTAATLQSNRGHIIIEAHVSQNRAPAGIGIQIQQSAATLPKLYRLRRLLGVSLRTSLATEVCPASENGPIEGGQIDIGPVRHVRKVGRITKQEGTDFYGRELSLGKDSIGRPHQKLATLVLHGRAGGVLFGKVREISQRRIFL